MGGANRFTVGGQSFRDQRHHFGVVRSGSGLSGFSLLEGLYAPTVGALESAKSWFGHVVAALQRGY
jgi:hypothetical protein